MKLACLSSLRLVLAIGLILLAAAPCLAVSLVRANAPAPLQVPHPVAELPFGFVVMYQGYIRAIDSMTNTMTKPTMMGMLGTQGGGCFDIVLSCEGIALISNFGDSMVFFVDVSDPRNPVFKGGVQLGFFAEDMVTTPSGKFALVTDGGFSPRIALINIRERRVIMEYDFTDPDYEGSDPLFVPSFQSVEITPDGRTVLCADYFQGMVHVLTMDPQTGALDYRYHILLEAGMVGEIPLVCRPVNITVSPDGRTALVANVGGYSVVGSHDTDTGGRPAILRIDGPGQVVHTGFVNLPKKCSGGQSVAFEPGGRRAYYTAVLAEYEWSLLYNFWIPRVAVFPIDIDGPGAATCRHLPILVAEKGTSQLFGVDTCAVDPQGRYLYVSNPTISGAQNIVDVIDLATLTVVKELHPGVYTPDSWDPGHASDDRRWIGLPVGICFPKKGFVRPSGVLVPTIIPMQVTPMP